MVEQEVNQGKVIGNIGILDLRSASEDSVAGISRIGNVGVVIFSPDTAGLIAKLNLGNLGGVIEAPPEARVITGQEFFGRDSFKHQAEPLHLVVSGQLIVDSDIPVEDLEQGLGSLAVSGHILCPRHLAGVIQSKMKLLSGAIQIYDEEAKLISGNLTLTESFLRSLEDDSFLMVTGRRLSAPEILPNDLLARKIKRIQVEGQVIYREENGQTLQSRLDTQSGSTRVTVIPAGFEVVNQPLMLDTALLESLPGKKLYCTDHVLIEGDVDAGLLDSAVETLIINGMLACPTALRGTLATKCNLLETRSIFYTGELWLVRNELTLRGSRFDYLDGQATLIVTGELTIADDVDPQVLADRLDKIHNFGEIFCSRDQMGALQARLGTNEGELIDTTADDDNGDGQNSIGNAGYLKL